LNADGASPLHDALARARDGDASGHAELVHTHQRRVFGIALRMLRSRAAAEDLVQEVFVRMVEAIGSFEGPSHLEAWLCRTTTNRAIDVLRRRPREACGIDIEALPDGREDGDPLFGLRLGRVMAALPPRTRAIIVLRFQEDLEADEIATALDMPLNTVKSQLRRALLLLRERLS
jgi:RNA polymerase sigma-70 factor, ECF subfamily